MFTDRTLYIFLIILLLQVGCRSRQDSSQLSTEQKNQSTKIQAIGESCENFIVASDTVRFSQHFGKPNDERLSSQIPDVSNQDFTRVIKDVRNAYEMRKNEPWAELKTACAINCFAHAMFEFYPELAEEEARGVGCVNAGNCDMREALFMSLAKRGGVQYKITKWPSEEQQFAIYQPDLAKWYPMKSDPTQCHFFDSDVKPLKVSLFTKDKSEELIVNWDRGSVFLEVKNCRTQPCETLENYSSAQLRKEFYFRNGEKIESSKYEFFAEKRREVNLAVKIEDCVGELRHSGKSKMFFPRNESTCINLEKIKQKVLPSSTF